MIRFILILLAGARLSASETFQLLPQAPVGGAGVFLDEIFARTNAVVPHWRVGPSPRLGQTVQLSRAQIVAALVRAGELAFTNCTGAEHVRLTRRVRWLEEDELKALLTTTLQTDVIKERGELELRLARPWVAVSVPEEPLTLKMLELPASGPSALFAGRFELSTSHEVVGSWQVSLHAKLWRDVWLSRTALRRGTLLADAELIRERRDVLSLREALAEFDGAGAALEIAEQIAPNTPLLLRALKMKPAVRRGQSAQAQVIDGALAISMKVEVLEDGIPGQTIRLRNPQTKRELRGKIQNEQTILVTL